MSSLPAPAATSLPKLPALLTVWRYVYASTGTLSGMVAGAALAWMCAKLGAASMILYACALLPTLALGAVGFLYAGKKYSNYQAELHADQGVVLYDGVWWRTEAWVPIARLQHIDVSQGPLDRRWGMATLTLQTAGTHDHATRIAGLPVARAHALRAALLPQTRAQHE